MLQIRNLMKGRGFTQKTLSSALHISQSTISQYINGARHPDPDTLIRLADYFGVSVDYLLGHTVIKEKAPAPSKEEQELMELWDELNPTGQEYILATMRIAVASGIYKNTVAANSKLA